MVVAVSFGLETLDQLGKTIAGALSVKMLGFWDRLGIGSQFGARLRNRVNVWVRVAGVRGRGTVGFRSGCGLRISCRILAIIGHAASAATGSSTTTVTIARTICSAPHILASPTAVTISTTAQLDHHVKSGITPCVFGIVYQQQLIQQPAEEASLGKKLASVGCRELTDSELDKRDLKMVAPCMVGAAPSMVEVVSSIVGLVLVATIRCPLTIGSGERVSDRYQQSLPILAACCEMLQHCG